MAAELVIAPDAAQDLDEAYGWYESHRVGLGEEFLSCVDACVQEICRFPEMFVKIHKGCRRSLVRRFPYAVFYEHLNGTIQVYCVFHTSRSPEKWRLRLP